MQKGFTLLELLVVLVITGLAGTFVAPNIWQTYTKAQERGVVQNVALALQAMRMQAYNEGRVIRLGETSAGNQDVAFPELPSGWELERFPAFYFLPTGVTNGARITLHSASNRTWILVLRPLDGLPEITVL